MGGLRGVVVEALELGLHAVRHARGQALVDLRQAHEALRQERQRAAAVGEDQLHVAEARCGAAEHQAGNRPRRVGAPLDDRLRDVRNEVAAAIGGRGMRVHDRAPAIELLHHRRESRVAEPLVTVAREQRDAVSLERVERVRDLAQRALDVRHRHHREHAETAPGVGDQPGRVVVARPRQFGGIRVVQEAHRRGRDRRHGRRHAGSVHVGDRLLRRPVAHRPGNVPGRDRREVRGRRVVMVHVDPVRLRCRHLRLRFVPGEERARAEHRGPGQKLAPPDWLHRWVSETWILSPGDFLCSDSRYPLIVP